MSLKELVNEVLNETGYVAELAAENTDEANGRIENIDELITKVTEYEENTDNPSLGRIFGRSCFGFGN